MSALAVSGLRVSYGAVAVLHDVTLDVRPGEIVCVIGANGAGKTTLLKTIAGVLRPVAGKVVADGRDIAGRPSWWVARRGIALVPEGRGVFADQSVRDNLMLGALARSSGRDAAAVSADLESAVTLFPALAEKLELPAGALSGGQQQMLAVARGLMARPRVLLLDEPSLGLAPIMVKAIFEAVGRINAEGTTVLLVEQNLVQSLRLSHRGYVLETGRIVLAGTGEELLANPHTRKAFLGLS